MTITNHESGTNVHEIADGVFRVSTPIPPSVMPGGFTFNQMLVVDDEPLLFHTGPRRMFPLVREGVAHILGDVKKLRYVAFSHVEADECGAMNDWLAAAPHSVPVCSNVAAMVSMQDLADRPPKGMADGEELSLGKKRMRWLDAPHVPHSWDCGYMFEVTEKTLLCGDIFTRFGGAELPALTSGDIICPAEEMRVGFGGWAYERDTRKILEKLAATEPKVLALMHGSSFSGNGGKQILELAKAMGV